MIALMALFMLAIFTVLPTYVAWQIGKAKRRHGFLWGILLGWLGVIVVALLPRREARS